MTLSLITLLVPSYGQGLAFFVDGLGWTLVSDEDQGRKRWVVVAPPGGGTAVVLAEPTRPAQVRAMGAQTGDRVGFFLQTRYFDIDSQRIVAAGGHFLEEPRYEPYGTVAQWKDPWGNRWDLIQPVPEPLP